MKVLLHPAYFPAISHFVAMANYDEIVFEKGDNYQKQTYRNRMYIYGANGIQMLSIPIKHVGGNGRQPYKDVRLENDFPWQKEHWKTLQSAYRTSPFFEYYEDELVGLFTKKHSFLMDFNLKTIETVLECLPLETELQFTEEYIKSPSEPDLVDARPLIVAKSKLPFQFERYTQVFDEKYNFMENLSILDLLFNEGTNALTYLEQQTLPL